MAHPLHHAESSAAKWGGLPSDYQVVHDWMDATKAFFPGPQHRALRHHSAGIAEAERVFGTAIRTSSGRQIPVRWIGEQHVREDCRRIPTVQDWLQHLQLQPWMVNGRIEENVPDMPGNPLEAWQDAVASGLTHLSFRDWCSDRETRMCVALERGAR